MSGDPAVEAAKRAQEASGWWKSAGSTPWDHDYAVDAIREALKPIRDLHQPMELKQSVFNGEGTFIGQRVSAVVCGHCYGRPQVSGHCDDCDSDVCEGTVGPYLAYTWPCATARLVYSEAEL